MVLLLIAEIPKVKRGLEPINVEKVEETKSMAERVLDQLVKTKGKDSLQLKIARDYLERGDSLLKLYKKSPESEESREILMEAWRCYSIAPYLAVKFKLLKRGK